MSQPLVITASAESHASAPVLWSTLMDLSGYRRWNPFTPVVRGRLEPGRHVLLLARLGPGLFCPMVERVESIEPGHQVVWGTRIPFGLLTGRRVQRVESRAGGGSSYTTEECFTGLLAPIVRLVAAGLVQRGFDATARGLAQAAEATEPILEEVA